ncbi:MAG: phosphotransferase [Anaerolineales bacterium]|nr:phosphotransferase [Anaerolineales bacterium]
MEKSVLKQFNESIFREAARRFGLEPDNLRLVSDMENLVYENGTDETPYILRITHSSHRTLEAILGEFEWMEYLHAHGVSVPQPIHSVNRMLIEVIHANHSHFLAAAFQKISGKTILDANECTPEIYEQWGQILGRMHALAKYYEPSQPSYKRAEWYSDDLVCNAEKYIPSQVIVLGKLHELIKGLHTLPKESNSYGLIHADFTDVNFFIHNHQITVFDFDDCLYHWFMYDIATTLHDSPWLPHGEMNDEEFAHYFWGYFVKGYQRESALEPFWINQLVKFIKLRDINLYVVYHKKWDFDNLSEGRQRFLKKTKHNIENDIPSLTLNLL